MSEEEYESVTTPAGESVVDQILSAFVAKIEAEPEMAELGERLRRALFGTREDSEADLKVVLFGEDGK